MRLGWSFLVIELALALAASGVASASVAVEHRLPLFEAFPSLEERVARIELIAEATPFENARTISQLQIKRDDHSAYGGNKARKLEFLLADAIKRGATTVVTSGNYGSNHALATTAIARKLGLEVILLLGPQPVTEDVRKKLLAFHALGAKLRFHSTKVGLGLDIARHFVLAKLSSGKLYYIAPGGTSELGDLGYVNAFFELKNQTAEMPAKIILPVGTGGTAAGLLVGSCLAGQWEKTQIVGVGVSDPLLMSERKVRKEAHKLYRFISANVTAVERARMPSCDFKKSSKAFKYIASYFKPGYGVAYPQVHMAVAWARAAEGLVLEPIYTGKAMRYLLDEFEAGHISSKVLFWHTYKAYDLDHIIDQFKWSDARTKWKDLPKPFRKLFTGRAGDL